jgi:Leucine-rich repeat (LRR) protein
VESFANNLMVDVRPLTNISTLNSLFAINNKTEDISSLKLLPKLYNLSIYNTPLREVSPKMLGIKSWKRMRLKIEIRKSALFILAPLQAILNILIVRIEIR